MKIMDKMNFVIFFVFSSLSCALSSKTRGLNDKAEFYTENQKPNHEARISSKYEQSFFTSTDALGRRVNISSDYNPLTPRTQESNANISYPAEAERSKYIQKFLRKEIEKAAADVLHPRDSDGITYIPAKETNQTKDGIRHEFLNVSRISEDSVTEPVSGKRDEEKTKKTEDKLEEGFPAGLSNNVDVKTNISKLSNNVKSNTSQEVEFFQRNNGVQINDCNTDDTSVTRTHSVIKLNDSFIRATNMTKTENVESKANNQILNDTDEGTWKSEEDGLIEAANFGLQAMYDFYYIEEPKLYSMGLYLEDNNPARYVAAFNDQSEEARNLARFGYAALQGTTMFLKKFPNTSLELPSSRSKPIRRSSLEEQCPRRDPPLCPRASLRYRTSDGSCNNLQNLWWGSAMSAMRRFLPPEYDDGVQSIRRSKNGRPLPSARDVSSFIHENKDVPLASITHMLMQWGQFVDHDLTATGQSRGFNGTIPQCCLRGGIGFQPPEFMHPECLPIAVNLRDNFYGPFGVRCLEFLRSGSAPKEGCEFGPREQLSQVTSYLDASMVYSSNAMHSDSLRIFRHGLLQYGKIQSRRSSLLKRDSDLCKRGSLSATCFRAGDGRLSEQPGLTSLHVVFLRLHNRIAMELSALNSHWSDEKLFQETRRIVGAVIQHITYREFLPIILGPQVMKIFDLEVLKKGYYEGYDPNINPTVANSFSAAAYRFGHSLVQRSFIRFDSDHRPVFNNVSIHDEFSNPTNLDTGSVDRLLLGLINQPCQRRDEFITEEITNHLFQTPGFSFGMDLAAINIQRGRDHGLPPYARWREPCGLSPIETFEDLDKVMSPEAGRKFKLLYSSVEDIDLFSAGLAERSVVGGLVGPTFACIIAQQFSNLRRGDRFWYENPDSESSFTLGQLQQIRQVSLAQVLCRTIDSIKTIQPFVFLATDTLKNRRFSCDDPIIGHLNLEFWAERLSEFKSDINNLKKIKRTMIETNDSTSRSKKEDIMSRRKISHSEDTEATSPKPYSNSVNQENKIIIKRPVGRPDNNNVTIVVQNNAINAPVFVNEGIYGSRIKIKEHHSTRPNYPTINPLYLPHGKPIPTSIPHSPSYLARHHPYVPYSFNDPHNPNPLSYGYRSSAFMKDNVFYDNYSATSPRPTLYTYYTNFQQTSTTQTPEVDGYLINYGHRDSLPAHTYERPKPPESLEHSELNNEQKPNYDSKPLTNIQLTKPSYASSDESYHTHRPSYHEYRPSTTARPNSRPNYESNNEPYHTHKPSYDEYRPSAIIRPNSRPLEVNNKPYNSPQSNSRPNDNLHQIQKPFYGFISSLNLRPNIPSQESYGIQKPSNVGNIYTQNDDVKKPNENYSANFNKPQYGHWNSNYQKRPSESLYDDDDPDAYRKKPNIKPPSYNIDNSYQISSTTRPNNNYNSQFWKQDLLHSIKDSVQTGLYGSVPIFKTNSPLYEKNTDSNISSSINDDYDRYFTTPIYQKISSTSSNTDTSFYIKENSTSFSKNPFYNLPTSRPIYQKDDRLSSKLPIGKLPIAPDSYKHDSYYNPTQSSNLNDQLLSSTPYWSETSTTDVRIQENKFNFKPTKVQSVTIVNEAVETIQHPGHSGYISQYKTTSEIPRPLAQQIKINAPINKKAGQYYYERNVLHRYPGEVIEIPKSNHHLMDKNEETVLRNREMASKIIANSKATQSNDSKLTTPTLLITDRNNDKDDVMENLRSALLKDIERVASASDRTNHWTNLQEDLNLSSGLEMPTTSSNESASTKELPKPIKLRSHAT